MRGSPCRAKVGRRRAADEPRLADLAPDQVLAADGADAHGDVEAFVDEVDRAVGQLDVEAHRRIARDELGDRRRQVSRAERDRRR